jgi:hypothetical protein
VKYRPQLVQARVAEGCMRPRLGGNRGESVTKNATEVLVVDEDASREAKETSLDELGRPVSCAANGEDDPGHRNATMIGMHLPTSPQTADECRRQAEHFELCAQKQSDMVKALMLGDLAKFYKAKAVWLENV